MIYLDNAASTAIDKRVVDAMLPYLYDRYGNPNSAHIKGREAREAIDLARRQVAELINAEPEQIIFTSGGTEANNMVMKCAVLPQSKPEALCSNIEHDSILRSVNTSRRIQANREGVVTSEAVKNALNSNTGLVSIMYVNNETGVRNPVCEISKVLHDHGVKFHTDCVQALGCIDVDMKEIGCDFASISSHKIHGAKGVGALYIKEPGSINPLIIGGSHQEYGYRGGTENVAGIVGFGKACEIQRNARRVPFSIIRTNFENSLRQRLDEIRCDVKYTINGRSCGKIINITFHGIDGETLMIMLDSKGVYVSSGSACRSHETSPSYVLKAMGLRNEDAYNSIRISFSGWTTNKEVETAAYIIAECVSALRKASLP